MHSKNKGGGGKDEKEGRGGGGVKETSDEDGSKKMKEWRVVTKDGRKGEGEERGGRTAVLMAAVQSGGGEKGQTGISTATGGAVHVVWYV